MPAATAPAKSGLPDFLFRCAHRSRARLIIAPSLPTAMAQPHGHMETFVLVRPMPRVGATAAEELKALSAKSNDAIRECHAQHAEHHIKWIHSYVTDDATYCVYKASSVDVLKARPQRRRKARRKTQKCLI
jgi:hypothetical protein